MKIIRHKGLITVMLIISAVVTSCGFVHTSGSSESRKEKWAKDITLLKRELPRKHKNMFEKLSEDGFNKRLDDLKGKVDSLSDDEVKTELSKIVASVGDAHTVLSFSSPKTFPMQLYWFEEGMYVTNTTEEYKKALNTRLVSINGNDVSTIADRIKEIIPHENDAQLKKSTGNYMMIPEYLKGLKILNSDEADMVFKDEAGNLIELKVKPEDVSSFKASITGTATDNLPLYRRNPKLNYWYEYIEDEKTLYFKYNSCRDMEDKSFKDFNKEMFEFIDSKKPEKLVIDLRNNGGGSSPIFDPFLKELEKREYLNDSKKMFVVIGRQTFSSAILNACSLRNSTRATFIGEPTGGKPNHYGEVKTMKLPENNITVSYSTKYFKYFKDDINTMVPDILINPTFKDFIDNRDGVLQYIFNMKM